MRARRRESKQLASQAAVNNKTLAEFKSGCSAVTDNTTLQFCNDLFRILGSFYVFAPIYPLF